MRAAVLTTLCALLAASCAGDAGPPLTVSNVVVYAPLPGSNMAVAYFTIDNGGDDELSIGNISSPQFGHVAIHETSTTDGVARMASVDSIAVPARASVTLQEGGMHLMLMEPRTALASGDHVSLTIHYAQDGMLIVDAVLRSRLSDDQGS